MMDKTRIVFSKPCLFAAIFLLCYVLPSSFGLDQDTELQRQTWEDEVPQLKYLLAQIKRWRLLWAKYAVSERSIPFFLRINCIVDEDATADFSLLSEVAALLYELNQYIPDASPHLTIHLSLVPGIHNSSGYSANLDKIREIADTHHGIISHVLLDLSFVDVGPLDGISLSQKWAECNARKFSCGFIFDSRICPRKASVFGHIHLDITKPTPVYFSTSHVVFHQFSSFVSDKNLNSRELERCVNAMTHSSMIYKGYIREFGKMSFNSSSTVFGVDISNMTDKEYLMESTNDTSQSKTECELERPEMYSSFSSNQSSSLFVSISAENLFSLLSQDIYFPFTYLHNETNQSSPFLELFHRFLVRFQTIDTPLDESNPDGMISIKTLLESVLNYSVRHQETYHLRPLELLISFSPKGDLNEELYIVGMHKYEINTKLPGTVKQIVLDYNNLRVDDFVHPVIKGDLEMCKRQQNRNNLVCGFIFHGRNCHLTTEWLTQLQFQEESLVLIRGENMNADHCAYAIHHAVQVLAEEDPSKTIKIDFKSKTVEIPHDIMYWGETTPHLIFPIAISSSDSNNRFHKGDTLDSVAPPFVFSKFAISFQVKIEDLVNKNLLKLISEQNQVVISLSQSPSTETSASNYFLTMCSNETDSPYEISLLINYYPDLAENLTMLEGILSGIATCSNLIKEVLIEWDPCFTSCACDSTPYNYFSHHLDGLTNVTKYVEEIKIVGVKTGVIITNQTFKILLDAKVSIDKITDFLEGSTDTIENNSNFYLLEVVSVLDPFESFVYEVEYPLSKIFELGAYQAAMGVVEQFEFFVKLMSQVHDEIFHRSIRNRWEFRRFKLKLTKCNTLNAMARNETQAYVRFWEIINNWAEKMEFVVIMDPAYESPSPRECKFTLDSAGCGCGWWFLDESSGKLYDRQAYARLPRGKLGNNQKDNVNTSVEKIIMWALASFLLAFLGSMSALIAMKAYRRRYIFSRTKLKNWLSEFPENVDPDVDMSSSDLIGQGSSKTSVYRCKLKIGNDDVDVAVKVFKSEADIKLQTEDKMALRGLISEARTLRSLHTHANVVKYFGVCTSRLRQGEMRLVLEYCALGSLNTFLPTLKHSDEHVSSFPLTNGTQEVNSLLNKWTIEIATGLEYLASEKIVHADIATRNILLDQDMCCKICDFGLSRKIGKYSSYMKNGEEPLPWRWMAPESLRKLIFNEKTDIWMFGVTLWEIYTFGEVPYGGLAWGTEFPGLLEDGLRLELPKIMPQKLARMVETCWDLNIRNRPTFSSCKLSILSAK